MTTNTKTVTTQRTRAVLGGCEIDIGGSAWLCSQYGLNIYEELPKYPQD
jgi:hypothetical protein